MYRVFLSFLKYIVAVFIISTTWAFCWWMFMVYLSTKNLLVIFLLVINALFLHGCIRWVKNQKVYSYQPKKMAFIVAMIVVIAVMMYSHFSSQWLFEDITILISKFTGTISFMFNYTRHHVDVVKAISYIGCLDYLYLVGTVTYVWFLSIERLFVAQKFSKIKS